MVSNLSLTQTGLYSFRRLEGLNFGLKKERDCIIQESKTVTAQPICAFVFAYAKIWLFHEAALLIIWHRVADTLCAYLIICLACS